MTRRLTLSFDADLLKRTRKLAADHNTSVNQIVRDYLGHLAREQNHEEACAAARHDLFGPGGTNTNTRR